MQIPVPRTFGERLKLLRDRKGIGQVALGAAIGVEQSTVSSYENNLTKPTVPQLAALCDLFGVSADYLLVRTDYEQPVPGGAWLVDLDQHENPKPDKRLAVPIPLRPMIVTDSNKFSEMEAEMRDRLRKRGKGGRANETP